MKKAVLIVILAVLAQIVFAQDYLDGNNSLCPTTKVELTKAPKGYKPFYISHYGRHGARYAWQDDMYDTIRQVFEDASVQDNLTPAGYDYKERFEKLYPSVQHRAGELSSKGRTQQMELAALMYSNYPEIFIDGTQVRAYSSPSRRCMMSMSAFCLGLMKQNPQLDIKECFGNVYLDGFLPLNSSNPFRTKDFPKSALPFEETAEQYFERNIDCIRILDRLFKDSGKAVPQEKQRKFVSYLSTLAKGTNSLDTDLDFKFIFTEDERKSLWEVSNIEFYRMSWPNHKAYTKVVKDIISKADEAIAEGRKGAALRFIHDDSMLSLLMLLGVETFGNRISTPEDVSLNCPLNRIPMGANLHFVLYGSRKSDRILFKVLLNGEEAHLPMHTDNWPYYDWEQFKKTQKTNE